ncbi:MAG TPA: anti-sigma factor [Candidatus Angelobacter sp.]|jgi:anti-sigma-K factor RskA|nr:anti-sigma factor [Candidatus Angelobacter sp.]
MDHQDYQDLLVLHSLDALDGADMRLFEEHLSTCQECRAELIELRDAAGLLAHAATPAEPGSEVRARILASISAARAQKRSAPPANVVQLQPRAQRNIWTIGLRIAAGIAFVALLAGVILMWRRDVRTRQEMAQLSRQLNTQQHELVRDREILGRQRDALAVLNSPDAKKMELAGTQTAQGARGTFVYDQKTGRAILMADGLPATTGDKAYELWFIPKGHSPMPGKMFTVDASGHAMLPENMPAEAMENAVIAITLEPRKGSAVPTGAIYLSSPSS